MKMTEKKAPSKKKGIKIEDIKKTLIIGGIISAIAVAGIIVGISIISDRPKYGGVLYFCGYGLPNTIDPPDVTQLKDSDFINQIAEGLFDIGENSEIIYGLATGHEWSTDGLNLTCELRKGVKFHDGTPFNAAAVKWNFDRAYRILGIILFDFLWLFPDDTPIINETKVLDEHTVRFILNAPYAPFPSFLASTYSYIVSPTATPADDFIDEDLVGTGPFFIFNATENNVTLSANLNYWGGRPKIDQLIFIRPTRSIDKALLSGEIHMKKAVMFNDESTLNSFRINSSFTVSDSIPDPFLDFIVMNNKLIDSIMRKAISYAINYSSYHPSSGWVKAKGPIPEGILYHNITGIELPYYNITTARQTLKDGNWPGTDHLTVNNDISPGNEWELLANSPTPLEIYNFSACHNWPRTYQYSDRLVEDLKQIGVKVEPYNISLAEWEAIYYEEGGYHRDMIELGYNFWFADYNDPSNFITEFYTNKKLGDNLGQVNDIKIQEWLEQAVSETDSITRRKLYNKIQKRLIEVIHPNIWLHSWIRTDVYVSNLKGYYPSPIKDSFETVYF
jgi:peptide/nickel transport system substrate-binding protein